MLEKLGAKFTNLFLKYMPNSFVFALLLTLITAVSAFIWLDAKPLSIIESWYNGFFDLLGFAMQITLIIITGYSIALLPVINKGLDRLTKYITTPKQVYFIVVFVGGVLSLVSFGWTVVTCLFARELALRVKKVNYPFLIACVYFSNSGWVCGLSSSIPLLLNSENNYLIEAGLIQNVIPTSYTLGSVLNIVMMFLFIVVAPLLMVLLAPKKGNVKELSDMLEDKAKVSEISIKDEANSLKLPFKAISDRLNNSMILQMIIVVMGFIFIVFHFATKGFDLNFNIMIFIFIIIGLLLHKTPTRYAISMKRSSSNISGILFQYPFYAGIMGIMLYIGLGKELGQLIASFSTIDIYPFFAYITGGLVNFAIPSAGGEFAVIGPSIINAVSELGAGLPQEELTAMISRASLSVAYGESLSNALQPFFLLLVLPVMSAGVKIQARDIMGYLVIPFIVFFVIQSAMVVWLPL